MPLDNQAVDRSESPPSDQENIHPVTRMIPGPVTSRDSPSLENSFSNSFGTVGGQRCRPRKPLADKKLAIGRMVPTSLAKQSRVRLHLESNRQARRRARELLLQHGYRFPVELLDTDSESEVGEGSDRDGSRQDSESGNDSDSGYHCSRGGTSRSPEV